MLLEDPPTPHPSITINLDLAWICHVKLRPSLRMHVLILSFTALPTDTGWVPTTWYTFHPEVAVPATHDRTSVIFLLVRDRECFALVCKFVPSIAFLGHDLGAVPRVLLSHNDWE